MKDRLTIKIKIKPHFKQFLLSVYGKKEPLYFPKKDKFNDLLCLLLAKPPLDYNPKLNGSDTIEIIIPYFENLNIMSYNYLSQRSQKTFVNRVKKRFWVTFEDFMDTCFRRNINVTDSIALFIEKYNLDYDEKIEDILRKDIYRSRLISQKYPRRGYNKRKKHKKFCQIEA
jgi:hypothetical protein